MLSTDETPELLTVKEVAGRLRISRPTAYRLIGSGRLRAYRVGPSDTGALRVDPLELERWLAQRSSQGRPPPTPPGQGATSTGRKSVGTSARRQNQGGDTHA